MFIKIPFEKDIDFKTNISEITKMSLEHDFNVNDNSVLGNFYISGEYKSHEISINREEFNYTLPFTVELREDIKKDTLEFNIEDFSYDIKDNRILSVKIEYSLKASENETVFERVEENDLNEEIEMIDNFLESERKENYEEENKFVREDEREIVEEKKEVVENRLDIEDEKAILDSVHGVEETFVTYSIHKVKEEETLESIAASYKIPLSILMEYNDNINITVGDKLLIPDFNE